MRMPLPPGRSPHGAPRKTAAPEASAAAGDVGAAAVLDGPVAAVVCAALGELRILGPSQRRRLDPELGIGLCNI